MDSREQGKERARQGAGMLKRSADKEGCSALQESSRQIHGGCYAIQGLPSGCQAFSPRTT